MIQLIPAIDIIDGKCVRLQKGAYESKKVYDYSPLEIAQEVERCGFRRLHMVDLDGAKSQHVVNIGVLKDVATHTNLEIDFGGGIKSETDLQTVFDSGASYATVGSIAVTQPAIFDKWIERYGADRLILGADVNNGRISINGWKQDSELLLMPFIKAYYEKGIRKVLCTDISKDGMLSGTATDLYASIMAELPQLQLIASGGVSSINDIIDLQDKGIPAVVFGKAIYEGKIDLSALANHFNLIKQ